VSIAHQSPSLGHLSTKILVAILMGIHLWTRLCPYILPSDCTLDDVRRKLQRCEWLGVGVRT
jgi:hypothetical protein